MRLSWPVTEKQLRAAYRRLALTRHPDRGGSRPLDWRGHEMYTGEKVRFTTFEDMPTTLADWDGSGQIICARNATRVFLNRTTREHFGYPDDRPVTGDRVMCLQNDRRAGLYNGLQGSVKTVVADEMVFRADGRDYRVAFVPECFNQERRPEGRCRDGRLPFDYAYSVTCHKAQGDEFDDVLVFEQRVGSWDHTRWSYTAASRARERLTWVAGTYEGG
jgi:ATP-dependent exoDNAse (exonuclease V) alpha subunit